MEKQSLFQKWALHGLKEKTNALKNQLDIGAARVNTPNTLANGFAEEMIWANKQPKQTPQKLSSKKTLRGVIKNLFIEWSTAGLEERQEALRLRYGLYNTPKANTSSLMANGYINTMTDLEEYTKRTEARKARQNEELEK